MGRRRGAQRRQRARIRVPLGRLLDGALMAAVVAAAVAGAWWLTRPGTLPITRVQVEGRLERVGQAELEAVVAAHAGGFFSLDAGALREALVALPWVEQAEVRRIWPDTLRIGLEEQLPVARWGRDRVLGDGGELFSPPPHTVPADLPRLSGPAGSERQVADAFAEVAAMLGEVGLRPVALDLNARRAWTVTLADGATVRLGRGAWRGRLARFTRVYAAALRDEMHGLAAIDLRYSNGFAVRSRPAAAGADRGPGAAAASPRA